MSGYPAGQVCAPPELTPYLKSVHDLKPIVGVPNEAEVIAIHAIIRIAHKFVDVPNMSSPTVLSRLTEHLFNVQMARYRSRYPCAIFPVDTTYAPPELPAHMSVSLEPVSGLPTDEEDMKVQNAVWSYQRFTDIPAMFDPRLHANLSQHLFDIQMERYMRSCSPTRISPFPQETSTARPTGTARGSRQGASPNSETNNPGSGSGVEPPYSVQYIPDSGAREAIERSNQLAVRANLLAERSNLLIERSNQIAERANQLAERSHRATENSGKDMGRIQEVVDRLDQRFERSERHYEPATRLAQEMAQPLVAIGDVLRNMNKVLVGIQHAIVRNCRSNKLGALDCLVNEKGETPGESNITSKTTFDTVFRRCYVCPEHQLRVVISSLEHVGNISDPWLGNFLGFYGIGEELCDETGTVVKAGQYHLARERLRNYLSSCLG